MAYAATKTVTSREFVHDLGAAQRAAAAGDTVIITDHGDPVFVLLNINRYRQLTKTNMTMSEMLSMPEADAYEFDPAPVKITPLDLDM
jgi:prevent-host-death family protein